MPTSTNLELATALAPLMRAAAGMTEAAVRAQLLTIVDGWAKGDASLNRSNAMVIEAIDDSNLYLTEFANWKAGSATGGPGGDGLFPMTLPDGTVVMVPGLAKLMADQAAAIAGLNASGAVLKTDNYGVGPIAYSAIDETGESAMVDWMKQLDAAGLAVPTGVRVGILFRLFRGLVESGCWSKLLAFYLLAQENQAVSLLNLKDIGSFPLTALNSPNFSPMKGWKGGAVNSAARLQTAGGVFPGTPSQNNLSFGGFMTEAPTRGQIIYLGNGTRMIYNAGILASQINGGAAVSHPNTGGFFAASRGASNDARFVHDDDAPLSNTTASSANANAFTLLGLASGGQETDARLANAYVASNMTFGEMGAMRRIVGNYVKDLARIA